MMKLKTIGMIALCVLASGLVVNKIAVAQEEGGGGGGAARQRGFPQPAPEKQVTVTAIPGVIADGAQWKLVWQGPDNADGLVGMKDGSVLFAQEQPSTVRRIDEHDMVTLWASDTHGTGALGIDHKGHVIGVERTCSDPGGHPDQCHENAEVIEITPKGHTTLAKDYNGKPFWRMGELVCDSKGGEYVSDDNGTYYVDPKEKSAWLPTNRSAPTA